MENTKVTNYISKVLAHLPENWITKTTHRLDIYNESLAKVEFLNQFTQLYEQNIFDTQELEKLPTAFDYIRLGHPLSCLLEWTISQQKNLAPKNVISFSSQTIGIYAILRKNLLQNKKTQILYKDSLPKSFDPNILKDIYGYKFELKKVEDLKDVAAYEGSTVFITQMNAQFIQNTNIDFIIQTQENLGSLVIVNNNNNESYISEIQHVRRRETIAMAPAQCLDLLHSMVNNKELKKNKTDTVQKNKVLNLIKEVSNTQTEVLLSSSGLSMQYAILMGLVHKAKKDHKDKSIKIIVPPNCYGGTNDQARRVAACVDNVEVLDLPVDDGNDMANSVETILNQLAEDDAVPYIIAEIPTNPRVEVPELIKLNKALTKKRTTPNGDLAIEPVFILDQTFCPNVHFLGEQDILAHVQTIAYVSGSKFPSGGKCTAGYCVANKKAEYLINHINTHLKLCDNEATDLQINTLAEQLPSMNQRIQAAYENTREFVDFIKETLPAAKINFVSHDLAQKGFTPSVFSLDLPTKGSTETEKETYKRDLNHKLIRLMIDNIPNESQHCVSYGQLKGCYWTIPATSTQGTTKENDKDYIVRVACSADMDVDLHKKVFTDFINTV